MADARETLEMMREVARTRISMLRDGITFYDNERRSYYLRQYEEKLAQIEHLIRRISIRLVEPSTEETP
ncbi:hypothetical protein GeomeDRAFT_0487 [Geobacter metallireducens RCH3]|uniref:Uncharacterized protein n=1 Tax=Geobacter metallireducens (strain ATCC 53774 / DSM 7210 / GS-15) TaxID=269799 RepID=Q39U69_GEOMG|nr:hypothetical protein [Geobacter metallireducens]ABB32205.1 hypothetical protein Gmet_1976 [Geobacter metallireducens GS-15]EHP88606.1 hypothetical protein GeomeDRAFT_0487 [Geobacter metallireducens RCH3]